MERNNNENVGFSSLNVDYIIYLSIIGRVFFVLKMTTTHMCNTCI